MWKRVKPPAVPLIEDGKLNLKVLSPRVSAILKACLGKLDRTDLDAGDSEHVQAVYEALSGESCTVLTKGLFGDYGAPIECIKVLPPNPKRK